MMKNFSIFIFVVINLLLPFNTSQLKADDLNRIFNEGREKLTEKNYDEALKKFDKVIQKDPEYWQAYHNRGLSKQKLKDFEGSIIDFTKAIELNLNPWFKSYENRAFSKEKLGDIFGALEDYSKVIEINPGYEYGFYDIARLKEQLNEFDSALLNYSAAIKINENDPDYYYYRAGVRVKIKDFKGAIEDYSRVIKLDPKNYWAFHNRGEAKNNISDFKGAESDFAEALKINSQFLWSYVQRGYMRSKNGDHISAIEDFDNAIRIDPKKDYLFNSRGFSKAQTGDYIGAIKDFSSTLSLNPNNEYAYTSRAYYKTQIGDFKGALSDYSAAIKIDPLKPENYLSRAWTNFNLGDYEQANLDYKKVLDIGDNTQKLESVIYLMDNYLILSKLSKVPELIEKAKLLLNQSDNKEKETFLLYTESRYYINIGNFNKSEELAKKCLAKTNDSFLENACSSLLSNIYIDNKDYDKAKKFIKFRTYEGQISLAYIAFMEKKLQKAERILKRIYKRQFKIENFKRPDPFLSSMVGSALWFQGKNKEAKVFHEESLETYKSIYGEKNPLLIQPYINLAMVYFNENDFENTEFYLRKSLNLQFKFIQEQIPYLPLSQRDEFIKRLGISYPAIFSASNIDPKGKYLALFARLNRHGLLEEIEKKQAKLSSLDGAQKELNKKIIDLNNQISSINTNDIESIKKLNDEKELLELELYSSLPDFKSKIYSIKEISKEIPNNGVLIEYQKYRPFIFDNPTDAMSEDNWEKPRYQALLLFSNGVVETVDLGLAQEIEDLIKNGLIASEQYLPDAQEQWNSVGKSIINPLGKYIKDKKVLFISPDSELNKVPFAAVSSTNENKLLGEEFLLRLITTGRELVSLNKTNILNNNKSLVVANPNFNLKDYSSKKKVIQNQGEFEEQKRSFDQNLKLWISLPGTKKEGSYVANKIDGDLLTEDEASVLNVQERNSPKIIHIASHSFFLGNKEEKLALSSILFANSFNKQNSKYEDPLLRSGIVLSGANYPKFNKIDDGYLTALEVSKLDFSGTELVVISGCESGLGELKSGDSIYGLKRSIAVAGARSSLLSLWEVDDKATEAFMKTFYSKLKKGEGRSNALASTQKEFRNHSIPAWRHPYVWAAFQLSGDWRPIVW